ncbi:MAG TPA: GIY-YIG nuclease family protein [Pirellulales bacterium]|jgi:hypothetical protein|nr:GIY-YIG nuclease family protein [Pirellulales bacterium]
MPDEPVMQRMARLIAEAQRQRRNVEGMTVALNWSCHVPLSSASVALISLSGAGSCVYEIWQTDGVYKTAVYIGETDDLGRRLGEHRAQGHPNPHFRHANFDLLSFSYVLVPGQLERQAVERALWKLYMYQWNDADGPHGGRAQGWIRLHESFPEFYSINFNGARCEMLGVVSPVLLP